MKSFFFLLFSFFFTSISYAQLEYSKWTFGGWASISFDPLTYNVNTNLGFGLYTDEGTAVICTPSGDLQIYTNGNGVYNSAYTAMPNGTDLAGDATTTQSALIVPLPGSDSIYYLFSPTFQYYSYGARYSIIDMSLDDGKGEVIERDLPFLGAEVGTEKMTATRHQNGKDVWVLSHYPNGAIKATLITEDGIQNTVTSNVAMELDDSFGSTAIGEMKVSPNGKYIALTHYITEYPFETPNGTVELFSFDNSTGIINGRILVSNSAFSAYGISFSPNSELLYFRDDTFIKQYEISSHNIFDISFLMPDDEYVTAMQIGLDGKLYISRYGEPYLSIIHNPNIEGVACDFEEVGLSIVPQYCMWGLPNIILSDLPINTFDYEIACEGFASDFRVYYCGNLDSVSWDFGDPASGAFNVGDSFQSSHIYEQSGTYEVQLIRHYRSGFIDTVYEEVYVPPLPEVSLGADTSLCYGESVHITSTIEESYQYNWYNATSPVVIGSGTQKEVSETGWLYVEAISAYGCSAMDSMYVTVWETPLDLGADTLICHDEFYTLQNLLDCEGCTYEWSDGSVTYSLEVDTAAVYYVTAYHPMGCTTMDSVYVGEYSCIPLFIPNIITPNDDGLNDTFEIQGISEGQWSLVIYNRWGELVFEDIDYGQRPAWDGSSYSEGSYYYELVNEDGEQYKGWLQLVR